jgi:hypothetical protein
MHLEEVVGPQFYNTSGSRLCLTSSILTRAIRPCAFDGPPAASTNNASSCWHHDRSSHRFDKTMEDDPDQAMSGSKFQDLSLITKIVNTIVATTCY